ncbi:Cof-type HAD-IIB family hydrolase [Macrococcus equipercicus]|uniref:HAD family phosphatase n=1 Tax=Macrococcus equipercicus TaxID=69967 RepID=A0A9Q9BPC4_9STAP|nr:Cof-type HAD-IIB family hydrolase [Macrococcus equipercicus]UTH14795.1 HAD family phosphatase [Macrococcus equipercicus]
MDYRLVVLDMDDTLMTSDNVMSERTKNALLQVQQHGVGVILASGRPTNGMVKTAEELQLDKHQSYILSYNGARIFDMSDFKMVKETALTKDQFDKCYDYCKSKGFFVLTYVDETIVYEGEHPYMDVEHELTGLPMKQVASLKDFVQSNVPKLVGVDFEENISRANQELGGHYGHDIHVTTSKPFFLEFMAEGVSKGRALRELVTELGIDREAIMAFGDSNNDKDMIEYAGLGVAMGNANEAIKKAADLITKDHNSDGIADVLEQYILKK